MAPADFCFRTRSAAAVPRRPWIGPGRDGRAAAGSQRASSRRLCAAVPPGALAVERAQQREVPGYAARKAKQAPRKAPKKE